MFRGKVEIEMDGGGRDGQTRNAGLSDGQGRKKIGSHTKEGQ